MNDLKFTSRPLLNNPRFTTMAVLTLALVIQTNTARAHPGVGIVRDRRGNIFYTDLAHVWRLTPDGAKSIAVTNIHTHELCVDSTDNEESHPNRARVRHIAPDGSEHQY